jgi:hypothetical protein
MFSWPHSAAAGSKGGAVGAVLPSASEALILGRSGECKVQLNYQTVSCRHASLSYENVSVGAGLHEP